MTTENLPPQPEIPPEINVPNRPISAVQLAKQLIASDSAGNEFRLEEFLLWPPDLFAFTSLILSITGAYHMVVSPPRYKEKLDYIVWPPVQKEGDPLWADMVSKLGLAWRRRLEAFDKGKFIEFKRINGSNKDEKEKERRSDFIKRRAGVIERYATDPETKNKVESKWTGGSESWVPKEVGEILVQLYNTMDEEWIGNIEDLMCDEQEDEGKEKNWPAFEALMTLHAIADEACEGWGIRTMASDSRDGKKPQRQKAQLYAEERLEKCGTLATIDNQRCRVLPKRHTPSVGITLRSVSANLAFHRSSVDVQWKVFQHEDPHGGPAFPSNALIDRMTSEGQKGDKSNDALSILLLPWPLEVHSLDFKVREVDHLTKDGRELDFFCYSPKEGPQEEFETNLEGALMAALRETDVIDMVVFPECALTKESVGWLEGILAKHNVSCYIAGVRDDPQQGDPGTGEASRGKRCLVDNMVYFKMGSRKGHQFEFPRDKDEFSEQHKHHRWKLNYAQIMAYQLGHILSPQKEWWEASKLRRRKVNFINIGDELTICPLICEDLARQDPIADLIRTAGPSLVVTILMDGPQRKDRWPAKYASVLTEDPGSAVVTLTSIGMVERWQSARGGSSRAVALWSDDRGSAREIELEKGAIGILLTLYFKLRKEPTVDGRASEKNKTNTLFLSGIHQIRVTPAPSENADQEQA